MKSNNSSCLTACILSIALIILNNTFSFIAPSWNLIFYITTFISGKYMLDDIGVNKWDKFFSSIGIYNKESSKYPKLIRKENTAIGDRFVFDLPTGYCTDDIVKHRSELETYLRTPVIIEQTDNYNVSIQLHNLKFKDKYIPSINACNGSSFPIGIALTALGEKTIYLDLDKCPHTIVGGSTGSGKSTFIKSILTYMCFNDFELWIMDLKAGGDYNVFKKYNRLTHFVKTTSEAEELIVKLEKLMFDRCNKLSKANAKDYKDYNRKNKNNKMQPLVIVIEEFSMLSDNKKFNNKLNHILALSRVANIKVILSIQRPSHDCIDSKLKANLNNVIAFKARNSYNSEILLDKGDNRAVSLNTGEAIFCTDYADEHIKSFYLDDKDIYNTLSKAQKLNLSNFIITKRTISQESDKTTLKSNIEPQKKVVELI